MLNTNDIQLKELYGAYKELKNSKMVLAPKHISKLLKVVAENNEIYNLIAEKILGYDYNGEHAMLDDGTCSLEEITQSERVIPFVFCLLNEIDNQEKEVVAVVRELFQNDTEEAFGDFCEQLVYPFISNISQCLGEGEKIVDDEAEKTISPQSVKALFTKDLTDRINFIVSVISEKVNNLKKVDQDLKNDLFIITYSIDLGLGNQEYSGILGLLSGLKRCLIPLKKFKAEIEEINLVLEAINNI